MSCCCAGGSWTERREWHDQSVTDSESMMEVAELACLLACKSAVASRALPSRKSSISGHLRSAAHAHASRIEGTHQVGTESVKTRIFELKR